jgi:hypothetical protein
MAAPTGKDRALLAYNPLSSNRLRSFVLQSKSIDHAPFRGSWPHLMRRPHLQSALVLLLAFSPPPQAQTETYTNDPFQNLPATSPRPDVPAPPRMTFLLAAEIPLPGPLPAAGPRARGELVEIAVAGGTVVTRAEADATPEFVPPSRVVGDARDASPWVQDERGRLRYRATLGGAIEAQRKCRRCKAGWKKRWSLRVTGQALAPPLVGGRFVYFGSLDNRVYCVKARNGHRVWMADVGARVSSPVVRWSGVISAPSPDGGATSSRELSLILAVPDGGSELIALDGASGQQVAVVRLGDGDGKLVGGPLATPDGRIVVALQKYAATSASLMVYRLGQLSATSPDSETTASSPANSESS